MGKGRLEALSDGVVAIIKQAVGSDWKGKLSPLIYAAAIPAAFWAQWLSQGLYVLVALLWLVPDRREYPRRQGNLSGGLNGGDMPAVTIIGSYLSPYVRKVLVCLDIKGVAYEIDPIVPFYGNDAFARLSPVRRIPVLIDDSVTLADSSVICEYLDERYPDPPLFPQGAQLRARARWLEEFADTRMGEVFIWHLFNQLVIRRFVWGETPDEQVLKQAREEEIPQVLDYLEGELPADGFVFGAISVADIALAAFFRNAAFARYAIDSARWPRTAAFVAHALDHASFAKLRQYEELLLRTPIAKHRAALIDGGAPVSAGTFGTAVARRGLLTI